MRPITWHQVNKDTVISCIQRVGSTSIHKGFPNQVNVWKAIKDYPVRVALLRHPLKRLASMWRHNKDINYIRMADFAHEKMETPFTYEEFVDYILENEDRHWHPQVERLSVQGIFVPTVVERFENLSVVWRNYDHMVFPHLNKTKDLYEYDEYYRIMELREYYDEDLKYWESIP